MSAISILEMLEQLSSKEKEHITNYITFIYEQKKKQQEEEEDELTEEDISELMARGERYLKNPDSAISPEEAKKRILRKHGL